MDIQNPDKTMTWFKNDGDYDELCIQNPYSKIACFTLMLYSMEFGSPPLYAEVNRVCRDMDMTYHKMLGPYIRVLYSITTIVETNREDSDKIKAGQDIQNIKDNKRDQHIGGVFLIFRGASMKPEWLAPYEENLAPEKNFTSGTYEGWPIFVYLPAYNSCTQDMSVALEFATMNAGPDRICVIFVISCANYVTPDCVRMNNEAYTAYPNEGEVLLTDGCVMRVLAIQRDVKIDNPYPSFKRFTGQTITVIHMLNQTAHSS